MTDQQILTGRGDLAEINGTLGVTVFGNVNGTMQTVLSFAFTGQVPVALAWLTGDFLGLGNTQIAEPWDNNGALALTVFGDVDGTLQAVFVSGDMGQGSSALAWLTGDFTGSGSTEIAQLWDNNGVLGLIIYANVGGTPQAVFVSGDMGQGSSALAWLTGDFTGSGSTEIAQPWDNNGTLEMIIYGNANGTIQTVFAGPMNQSSAALAWLTGNFIGGGSTQIAQLLENNGALQLIIYADVTGTPGTVFSNNVGQITAAQAWLTGNFTGPGNTQIAEAWTRVPA
jgi:hypothetical protein